MFFQYFLKGIRDLTRAQAEEVLKVTGIQCNWTRTAGPAGQREIMRQLSEDELIWHLTRYSETDHRTGDPFGLTSPFISITSGTAEQSMAALEERAYIFSAFDTASWFATNDYTGTGWIFFGYVFTIGRPSVEYAEFAEEVRDLHSYPKGYAFHHEGEIVAKITIPPIRLERCERYRGPVLRQALESGALPEVRERDIIRNENYVDPMRYINVRGIL